MAAPFGFSAGDFIAAIKLTQQTTQALRKSVGAAAHFQQTLVDLGTLESILRRVSTLTPETASAATVQSVHLCSLAIRVPLKRFEHEIRKFEPYLTWPSEHAKRPASDFLVGAGRKIQWTVAVVEEVAKLKASIAPQLAAIELHLQLEALERESVREKDYVQMLARVEAIHCKLDGLTALAQDKVLSDDNAQALLGALQSTAERVHNAAQQDAASGTASPPGRMSPKVGQSAFGQQTDILAYTVDNVCALCAIRQKELAVTPGNVTEARSCTKQSRLLLEHPTSQLITPPGSITNADPQFKHSGSAGEVDILLSLGLLISALRRKLCGLVWILSYLIPALQRILRALTAIPRSLSALLDSNIELVDALGRSRSLPFEYFCRWDMVHTWLKSEFRGLPGNNRVRTRQYSMFYEDARNSRIILPSRWDSAVRPGQKVIMSILLPTAHKVAPCCGHGSLEDIGNPDWKRW